jgi:drug/metabolite transporter (DMT)-like permease
MLIFERPSFGDIASAWLPICYAGALSCGVAYTLQILGQKNCPPAAASIVLSLESVFGAVSGMIIIGFFGKNPDEIMNLKEAIGSVIVFIAVILAQLTEKTKK